MKSISVVMPVYNEELNIQLLVEEINSNLNKIIKNFEILIIDDASTDRSKIVIKELAKNYDYKIKLIENKTNRGQSYSIYKAIKNASFDTIVTIDGDGQNNPADIPKILDIYFNNSNLSLVGGIRINRKDNFLKIISSKVANNIRKLILDDNCNDTGCSLKIFDKNVFLLFPFFDGMHRFLPALFSGFSKKTLFINVDHRKRIHGKSKYGTMKRLIKGIIDIIKVSIIIKNYKKND
jgi:dolichol-phosphate mannosyltransferase